MFHTAMAYLESAFALLLVLYSIYELWVYHYSLSSAVNDGLEQEN